MSDAYLEPSVALHARARAFVRSFEAGEPPPEPFDALATDLARFQARFVPGYARLCAARGIDPERLRHERDAPAVPTDAFKVARVATFPEEAGRVTFRTSGTTIGARGSHEMRDPSTYDAAALASGRHALMPGLTQPPVVLALAPSPEEAPDSSLSHMLGLFASALGAPTKEATFLLDGGVLDLNVFDERVARAIVTDTPVLVLGTSFAFVHLIDGLGGAMFRLPPQSRVMQTGGFKGRSREVSAPALRRDLSATFGAPASHVVGEYGMTELSSQFYEGTLRPGGPEAGVYVEPPWARVTVVDPETLAPLADGQVGIARIVDLMNVDSAFAVLTADRVRRVPGGFELLGRAAGAPPRGCSIAIDEMLGGA